MKCREGKIVEITESELFYIYIERGIDELLSFREYVNAFVNNGTKVLEV